MSARRVCACGADLAEAGDVLVCVGCGARARTWLVLLDGRAVAVGAGPRGAGSASQATVAFTPRFEAQLRELLEGPPDSLRYAIPRSWRRRGGHHRKQRS